MVATREPGCITGNRAAFKGSRLGECLQAK